MSANTANVGTNLRSHVCDVCDQCFHSPKGLKIHTTWIHRTAKKRMPLKLKKELFSSKEKLKQKNENEAENHENVETSQTACAYCNKVFLSNLNCLKHIESVHRMQKRFACLTCGKRFSMVSDVRKHHNTHWRDNYAVINQRFRAKREQKTSKPTEAIPSTSADNNNHSVKELPENKNIRKKVEAVKNDNNERTNGNAKNIESGANVVVKVVPDVNQVNIASTSQTKPMTDIQQSVSASTLQPEATTSKHLENKIKSETGSDDHTKPKKINAIETIVISSSDEEVDDKECPVCSKNWKLVPNRNEHVQMHKNRLSKDELALRCIGCLRHFPNGIALIKHQCACAQTDQVFSVEGKSGPKITIEKMQKN